MPEGRFQPEGRLPTPHSHAFDKALDLALADKSAPETGQSNPQLHDVTLQVTLKWSDNPGWVVDSYIVSLGG